MKDARLLRLLGVLPLLGLVYPGCGDSAETPPRPDPPVDDGLYGYANGCVAVEGYDGTGDAAYLKATSGGDAFAFSEPGGESASHFFLRASDLGTYLFYDQDKRYLIAEESTEGGYRLARVEKLEDPLTVLDESFVSPAEWELETSVRDSRRYQMKHLQTGLYLTLTGLTSKAETAAVITLPSQEGCAEFPELTIDAAGATKPRTWDDGALYGIAELHSHILTNEAFGGGSTFHGAPFHRLGVEHALPDCSPWHGEEGRRDVVGYFFDGGGSSQSTEDLIPILTTGQVPEFNHFTAGYPEFTAWPKSWASATHQTMYYKWIERAYLAGLRLVVQHVTGNSVLCDLVNAIGSQEGLHSCNDMVTVDHALTAIRAMERYIDAQSGGPGKGWFHVVETPAQAREVIKEGKLAVVLGIEISNIFDCFLTPKAGFEQCTTANVVEKIEQYREQGVRVFFPVHKFDNAFSAGDGSDGIIELGNFINSGHYSNFVEDCPDIDAAFDGGDITFGGINKPRDVYDSPAPAGDDMAKFGKNPLVAMAPYVDQILEPGISGDFCQKHGMTPLGETLMQELMKRGLMIDIAHLPKRSLERAYELMEANQYPPLKTHGSTNGGRLYEHGGMSGISLGRCASPDTPGTMASDLTSHVESAAAHGSYPSEALSFDLNGFAHGPRPRFGPDSPCGAPQSNPIDYPFTSYDGEVTFEQPHLGNREVDFNTEGMIHIGLLPELIEDVRRDGVSDEELEPLFRSAEAFIRLWEHAESRGKAL
ncbi:MAG: hypothetical protein R3F14_00890 [Polyangiaceae bacterium]